MNKAEELLKNKALVRGGIYLFSKEYAKQFVLECKKQSIIILGIDGFFIDEKTTQPSQDNSIDFSEYPFNESIYEKAINFLEARDESCKRSTIVLVRIQPGHIHLDYYGNDIRQSTEMAIRSK